MTSPKPEDKPDDQEVHKQRPVNLIWISIFAVILILSLVTQRRKEVGIMISDKMFFVSLIIVIGYIVAIVFVEDPLYTKAVYIASVALIIAIFTKLDMIWSSFYLILSLTMSFPSLQAM